MRGILLFICFFLITLCLYYPAREARFVFDFIDLYTTYQHDGWGGFLTDFHDFAFRPVAHIVGFFLHIMLKLSAMRWLVVVSLFHAAIAVLAYRVIFDLLLVSGVSRAGFIAFFSALLFLVSPYQTEVVVWGGAFLYLSSGLFFILAIDRFLRYARSGDRRYLYQYQVFFIMSVFCHEIAFTIPIMVALFILSIKNIDSAGQGRIRLSLKTVLLPLGFVPVYLMINKLVLGKWIGHYGAAAHLHFDVMDMAGKLNMYAAKLYLLVPFWKPHIYVWCQKPLLEYMCIACVMIGMAVLLVWQRYASIRGILMFTYATVVMLAMVLNLYLVDFINIQSDRLGYFASIFAFVPVMILVSRSGRTVAYSLATMAVAAFVWALHVNIDSWHQAAKIASALDKDFKYSNANHLYILNLPDNYKGAYMYRCRAMGKFGQKERMLTGADFAPKEIDVLSYNLIDPSDSVTVEKISDSTLKVSFTKWGSWFWRDTYGASDYQDSIVNVDIDDWNHSYLVTFHKKEPGDVFLYQAASQWRKVENF